MTDYREALAILKRYEGEERVLVTRHDWFRFGKEYYENGELIWEPVCIFLEGNEVKLSNNGFATKYVPTHADLEAKDWYMI